VVYCPASNIAELKEVRTDYPCDFFLVSDFLQDHTPMKILYGAQARPTCFFINKQGIVELKTLGLENEEVNQLLETSFVPGKPGGLLAIGEFVCPDE
jgi:hypothetical protein